MVDIHCHILPELDDGAEDLETSLTMCRMAAGDGIEATVCTMHASDRYDFDPDLVQQKIEMVSARSGGVPRLYPGCDFHLSYENVQGALADPRRFTINHGRYLLVEFANFSIPPHIDDIFFRLRSRQMMPIVTHPERNPWLLGARHKLVDWVNKGALVQVTAGALLGRFGESARRLCEWLLERRLIHFVATDAHNATNRPPLLSPAYKKVGERYGRDLADRIFKEYPRATLADETIEPEPPVIPKPKSFFDRIAGAFKGR